VHGRGVVSAGRNLFERAGKVAHVKDHAIVQFYVIVFWQKWEIVVFSNTRFPCFVETQFYLFAFSLGHPNKLLVC
jgi:hypothetical protein